MFVDVALPLPIPRLFTYRVPEPLPEEGTRVLVTFNRRRLVGWVVGPAAGEVDPSRIQPVLRVLDPAPVVPAELLRLCRWVADYYVTPLGQVLRAALPTVLTDHGRPEPPVRTRRIVRLTRELPSLQVRERTFGRAVRQRECYELLETMGGSAEVAHLVERVGFSPSVIQGLVARGVAEIVEEEVARDPFAEMAPPPPQELTPTPAQAEAIRRLTQRRPDPRPFLLRGVTGSGKTLVYIELLKEVVGRRGQGAIVLVPEIALTPQTVARFRAHFGDTVAVLHSGLSDGERYDAWRALRSGERRIAIGARSAVFAPVADLGAIVVDEEHETTYKQSDEAPRYHAREVAIVRARMVGATCVLGSATPSLESWHNVLTGKFERLDLPERAGGQPLPPVRIIDLRSAAAPASPGAAEPSAGAGAWSRPAGNDGASPGMVPAGRIVEAAEGSARAGAARGAGSSDGGGARPGASGTRRRPAPILSEPLLTAMADRLARGEQTILLLNRRGYSTFVQCRDCGAVWHCGQCSVALTYHRGRRRLVCHYCFHEEPPPITCDRCGSGELSFRGVGTEQVERAVSEAFPAARVARMDVDTTSGKWAHHQILGRMGRGEIDILLGTQMIAKGLDFPRVTLVGVVNADVGLNLPDFRATERTFQLITQVAGRAGRGPLGGEVLVQTALPGHYAIQCAVHHDYEGFAARELEERRSPRYPPHCRMANVVLSGTVQEAVAEAADSAARWVRRRLGRERGGATVEVTGPAPCPIERIRGRWRWHFLLRTESAARLGEIGRELLEEYPIRPGRADLRLIFDRDPVSLL